MSWLARAGQPMSHGRVRCLSLSKVSEPAIGLTQPHSQRIQSETFPKVSDRGVKLTTQRQVTPWRCPATSNRNWSEHNVRSYKTFPLIRLHDNFPNYHCVKSSYSQIKISLHLVALWSKRPQPNWTLSMVTFIQTRHTVTSVWLHSHKHLIP